MIDVKRNEALNEELKKLYSSVTDKFLEEYKKAFSEDTNLPTRLMEFGIADENCYDADNGILIILKEANGWADKDFQDELLYKDFVRTVIDEGRSINNDGREPAERVKMNMWYNLGRWITAIKEPDKKPEEIAEMYEDSLKALKSAVITNVNKVRGYASSGKEFWRIAESKVAIDTIKEEIKILKPKFILCGGIKWWREEYLGDYIKDYIEEQKKDNCKVKVLDMWHPAARKSKVKMIEEVKKQMQEV